MKPAFVLRLEPGWSRLEVMQRFRCGQEPSPLKRKLANVAVDLGNILRRFAWRQVQCHRPEAPEISNRDLQRHAYAIVQLAVKPLTRLVIVVCGIISALIAARSFDGGVAVTRAR